MKAIIVIIAIGLLAVGGYLAFKPDQAPGWLSDLSGQDAAHTTHVYKWRDSQGNWQITDEIPSEGTSYQTLEYRADVNVLPLPPQLQPKD